MTRNRDQGEQSQETDGKDPLRMMNEGVERGGKGEREWVWEEEG